MPSIKGNKPVGICKELGCTRNVYTQSISLGLCRGHYCRFKGHYKASGPLGKERGSGHFTKSGYFIVTGNGKAICLHKLVYEQVFGHIKSNQVIHHIDLDPSNNDVGNLVCMARAQHAKLHRNLQAINEWKQAVVGLI